MAVVTGVTADDRQAWLEMRRALWPTASEAEHRQETDDYFGFRSRREPQAVLIARDDTGRPMGFAELSIRPYAEGCATDRVGYLEGWYVTPEARRAGVGRALLSAAEAWARGQGCSEFASDTEADNAGSAAAHLALGFTDVGLVRCFRKSL